MQPILQILTNFCMKAFSLLPLQNKAVFSSFFGASYSDSPKAIFEKMKTAAPNCKYVWLMKDPSVHISGAFVVKYKSIQALYHLATSQLWVDNCRKGAWVHKRKGQYYVQTWHGEIALKKVEADAEEKLPPYYIAGAKHDSEIADLFLSGSKWRTWNYRNAFWYTGEILECGLPRADMFYGNNETVQEKVCEFYHISAEDHLILYAPTFRKDKDLNCYKIDYERIIQTTSVQWGGKWKILVRLHPGIQDRQNFIKYNDWILNGSVYNDINELIIASDILITDYSGCMFSAMQAKKKVFLFTTDLEDYIADRGFYFSFDELPFPIALNNTQLIEKIKEFDNIAYLKKIENFTAKIGLCNHANGAQNATDYIVTKSGIS